MMEHHPHLHHYYQEQLGNHLLNDRHHHADDHRHQHEMLALEEYRQQVDLENHIRQCQCSCNHLGYGNYWSYKDNLDQLGAADETATNKSGSWSVRSAISRSAAGSSSSLPHRSNGQHHLRHAEHNGGLIVNSRLLEADSRLLHQLSIRPKKDNGSNHYHHHHHHGRHQHHEQQANGSAVTLHQAASMTLPPPPDVVNEDSDSAASHSSRTELGSKQWCILCVALLVALSAGVGVGVPLALRSSSSLNERLAAAYNLLVQVPLVDGHNDLPWNVLKFAGGKINSLRALETGLQQAKPWSESVWSHTDLPRLREGRVGAQFWAAYVPCGAQYLDAVKQTLEQIDLIKRLVDRYPNYLRFAVDAKGIEEAHKDGRIASLLGVEGGHSLGNSLGVLRTYYDLGVRYVTLTHTCNTPWADCSIAEADPHHPKHGGLTHFGKLVVKEMNRLGLIVDLSHTSSATMHHALDVSRAPVIFSHSSTRALCNITRNVPDDVLKRLVSNGGIVMVSFFRLFVNCNKTTAIADVVAHINHIRRVAGVDHVGIGAGFDGINTTPQGLEDVSKYPYLFAELMQDPSWTEEDLKKLAGLNFLRVFSQVEKVREDLRRSGVVPDETTITNEELKGQLQCVYQERIAAQSPSRR